MIILPILSLTAAIILAIGVRVFQVFASYRWKPIAARITSFDPAVTDHDEDGIFLKPKIFFAVEKSQYPSSGKTCYQYDHYLAMDQLGDTWTLLDTFPVGQQMLVFVNPKNPDQVRLSQGPGHMEKLIVFFLLVFILVTVAAAASVFPVVI